MITALLCATTAFLPLLVPRGPGGTSPVDVFAALFLLAVFAAAATAKRRLALPAAGPLLLISAITALAVIFSLHPGTGLLSLLIEVYLAILMWAACNELRGRPDRIRLVMTVWVASAIFWAFLLVGAEYHLLPGHLEDMLISYDTSARVAGASRNPNLAASYIATTLFVLFASPWPRLKLARISIACWFLFAMYVTGSNGALLGVLAGAIVLGVVKLLRNSTAAGRIAIACVSAVVAGLMLLGLATVPPSVDQASVDKIATSQRGGIMNGGLGRLNNSVASRLNIWGEAIDGGLNHAIVGVGAGESKTITTSDGSRLGKGLHNDYLAFFIERGMFGFFALLMLMGVIAAWCRRLIKAGVVHLDGRRWRVHALVGGCVANAVISVTHESYHFRHLWLLFALVWVMSDLVTERGLVPTTNRLRGFGRLAPLPAPTLTVNENPAAAPAQRTEAVTHASR